MSSKEHSYILLGVDYFTKWVEAVALRNVTQQDVIGFIENHIFFRFRIPQTLTTDQGFVFTRNKVVDYTSGKGIKLLTSTPYYAQTNGQLKVTNKVIIALIKKHIGWQPRNWHNTLS